MQSVIEYLNTLNPLTDDCRSYLEKTLKERVLEPREYLLSAGDTCREICFIESGLLKSFHWNGDRPVCSWFTKAGDIAISTRSFFTRTPWIENIQAIKRTKIHYILEEELQRAYSRFINFNVNGRLVLEKYYCLENEKNYILSLATIRERYQYILKHYPWMTKEISNKNLASYLNASREQLNRIKSKI